MKYLRPGSVIGITCPAGYVAPERLTFATELLQRWGYAVRLGKTVGLGDYYFAGTDAERLADLQQMLDDPAIDAIMAGRGGYGVSRIIDGLDFSRFASQPKWLCGFSDITVLHSHIFATYGIPTLHSLLAVEITAEKEHEDFLLSLNSALTGAAQQYTVPATTQNRQGSCSGMLTGGNLSLLVHLLGTPSDVNMQGKILFIEDVGEHLYHIDRMLLQLKRAGKLAQLAGLIVGGFTNLEDTQRPFGQTIEEIIRDKIESYNYPVCFGFPAGHQYTNYTLALGVQHTLTVDGSGSTLTRPKAVL